MVFSSLQQILLENSYDLGPMVEKDAKYFLKKNSDATGEELRVLSNETIDALNRYEWPGNVRQLENTCYWLTLMSPTQNVQPSDLPNEILEIDANLSANSDSSWEDGFVSWLKDLVDSQETGVLDFVNPKIEKLLIKTALEKTNGKKNDAANLLGWGRNTLAKKALNETQFSCFEDLLVGPTMLAFSLEDPTSAAKLVNDFTKVNSKFAVKGISLGDSLLELSKLSAITTFTPNNFVPFAAQSLEDPVPYSLPPITTKSVPLFLYSFTAS